MTRRHIIPQRDGVTLLCNLHVPDLARRFGQRIPAMKQGTLVFAGPAADLDPQQINALYDMRGNS